MVKMLEEKMKNENMHFLAENRTRRDFLKKQREEDLKTKTNIDKFIEKHGHDLV